MDDYSILKDVPIGREFIFNDGTILKNIYDLISTLKIIDDNSFLYHCNIDKDDFSNWIKDVFSEYALSEELLKIHDKKKYLDLIEKTVKHREIQFETSKDMIKVSKRLMDNNKRQIKEISSTLKEFEDKIKQDEANIADFITAQVKKNVENIILSQQDLFRQELTKNIILNNDIQRQFEESMKLKEENFSSKLNELVKDEVLKELSSTLNSQKEVIAGEQVKATETIAELKKNFERSMTDTANQLTLKITSGIDAQIAESVTKQKSDLKEGFSKTLSVMSDTDKKFALILKDKETKLSMIVNGIIEHQLGQIVAKHKTILESESLKTLSSIRDLEKKFERYLKDKETEANAKTATLVNTSLRQALDKLMKEKTVELNSTLAAKTNALNSLIVSKTTELNSTLSSKTNEMNSAVNSRTSELNSMIASKAGELNSMINSSVASSIAKQIEENITKQRELLAIELNKAMVMNTSLEQKFEQMLKDKETQLINDVASDIEEQFSKNITEQKTILTGELSKAVSLNKDLGLMKKNFLSQEKYRITAMQDVLDKKIAAIDKEHQKYLEKISLMKEYIQKSDSLSKELILVSDMKKGLLEDRKRLLEDRKRLNAALEEHAGLMEELLFFVNGMKKEKKIIEDDTTVRNIYVIIDSCRKAIADKNFPKIKELYEKANLLYKTTILSSSERESVYSSIKSLYDEIQSLMVAYNN